MEKKFKGLNMSEKQAKLNVPEYSFLKNVYDNVEKKSFPNEYNNFENSKLSQLENEGYCILENCFDKKVLDNIRLKFHKSINNQTNIKLPRDLRFQNEESENVFIPRITDSDFKKGETFYRNFVDNIQLRDPLINMPECLDICLNKNILSIVSNYFESLPFMTYIKIVKNYANSYPVFDTQYYHIDENAYKLLKVFIYLNDVDTDRHGPFCYVKNSYKNVQKHWGKKARWSDVDINTLYNKEDILPICAKKGDVIICNTVAFHKGVKPIEKDRNIIIINYGLHQDYTLGNNLDITSNIRQEDFHKLSTLGKNVFKICNLV